jgi:hypothetical protein
VETVLAVLPINMPSGKKRLYVALYARGGEAKMATLEDT